MPQTIPKWMKGLAKLNMEGEPLGIEEGNDKPR